MGGASLRSMTSMPTARRRAVVAFELDTAPRIRTRWAASSAMKTFTVEPVPTPTQVASLTYGSAAWAARRLLSSVVDTVAARRDDCARSRGHSLLLIRFNERGTVDRKSV